MIIVPGEPNGVFADGLRGNGLGRGFKHGQHAGSEFGRLAGLATGFVAFFVAHGTGAGVAEIDEAVVRNVAVLPIDVDAGASGEVHFNRLGIRGRSGRLKRGLHKFQYRIRGNWSGPRRRASGWCWKNWKLKQPSGWSPLRWPGLRRRQPEFPSEPEQGRFPPSSTSRDST